MSENGWRWNDLNAREKELCRKLICEDKKRYAAGRELGIGLTRVNQLMVTIYRILGVENAKELALEMGKHWKEIE